MESCPICFSNQIHKARNDCGHFKAVGIKPIRMYQYWCAACGYVGTYAKDDAK